jgi:hypothetical protein
MAPAPQFFEPRRVAGGVLDRMLYLAVTEIILNESGIRALIGKRETAGMAQHVGMRGEGQGSGVTRSLEQVIDCRAVQWSARLTDE